MRKGWKILIGVVCLIAALLAINTLIVEGETKPATVTIPGGRILHLPDGDMQVLERGPRGASPIVLIHCYTCSIAWWQRVIPLLDRDHRVVAIDLRGFGGSEKPGSGYSIEDQASFVAEGLKRLGVRGATVVGQSLGGTVATALGEVPGGYVERLVIIDQAPEERFSKGLGFTAKVSTTPVIGPALWRVTPDFAIKEGLGVAFAPGYDVPDEFVDEFRRMTYTSYDSDGEEGEYMDEDPLNRRIARMRIPLLAIFGAEDQIYDARGALAAYAKVPGARTVMVAGAGHSPNVERPARTAALVLGFARAAAAESGEGGIRTHEAG
ncbi:MAG TPA: alpha/beta fold hydrolase [Solirubrobacterales bacterium]|jgi:pimeloyl-ACP methyl ester carboxylesterase|nr:alpha/beta fold hydrolase [Solirubrobacterales bacterium]